MPRQRASKKLETPSCLCAFFSIASELHALSARPISDARHSMPDRFRSFRLAIKSASGYSALQSSSGFDLQCLSCAGIIQVQDTRLLTESALVRIQPPDPFPSCDEPHAQTRLQLLCPSTRHAWRQMLFYLSMLSGSAIADIERHFAEQPALSVSVSCQ